MKFNEKEKVVRVLLRSKELLQILNSNETDSKVEALWRPEYGAFMLESSPGRPYVGLLKNINLVEANMRRRRQEVREHLFEDEFIMTLTSFPRLGTPEFTWPRLNHNQLLGQSICFPDEAISQIYPRFMSFTHNVRQRRGENVKIALTVFKDENTEIPVEGSPADQPGAVYMDAIGFGASCCCLQVTFQVYLQIIFAYIF